MVNIIANFDAQSRVETLTQGQTINDLGGSYAGAAAAYDLGSLSASQTPGREAIGQDIGIT